MINVKSPLKEVEFTAKVIRANGEIEDLGTIAYYNSNFIKRIIYKLKKLIKNQHGNNHQLKE